MSRPVRQLLPGPIGFCAFVRMPKATCRMCKGERVQPVYGWARREIAEGVYVSLPYQVVIGSAPCRACGGYGFTWADQCDDAAGDVCLTLEQFAGVKLIEAIGDGDVPL